MKKLIYILAGVLTLSSCQKNEPDDLFGGKTPSQRFEQSQAELRRELAKPENGWKLTYFTNDKKFGGFTFLMKFTSEGFVSMASDIKATATATTSKYEIQEGQGTMLVFTTKNYIHELSDAYTPTDLRGKGYEGEFQFIYYGKEGNKLKFRTQRKATEQYVYFEPASAQEWSSIQTFSSNIKTLEDKIDRYYFTVSTTTSATGYEMSFSNRFITLTSLDGNSTQKASVYATETGIGFKPALTFEGKTFTGLTRDNSTTPPTYKTTVDGVTAQMVYSLVPPEAFITDDYRDISTRVVAFILLTDVMKANTRIAEIPFYENVLKVNNTTDFTRIQLVFQGTKCIVSLGYNFNGTEAYYIVTFDYELNNKRFYLKNKVENTLPAQWQVPANSAILQKARSAINYLASIASEGFYVTKLSKKIGRYTNPAYTLQSVNTPENVVPFFAQVR